MFTCVRASCGFSICAHVFTFSECIILLALCLINYILLPISNRARKFQILLESRLGIQSNSHYVNSINFQRSWTTYIRKALDVINFLTLSHYKKSWFCLDLYVALIGNLTKEDHLFEIASWYDRRVSNSSIWSLMRSYDFFFKKSKWVPFEVQTFFQLSWKNYIHVEIASLDMNDDLNATKDKRLRVKSFSNLQFFVCLFL